MFSGKWAIVALADTVMHVFKLKDVRIKKGNSKCVNFLENRIFHEKISPCTFTISILGRAEPAISPQLIFMCS